MRQKMGTARRRRAGPDGEHRQSAAGPGWAAGVTLPYVATLEFGDVESLPVGTVVAMNASGTGVGATTEAYDPKVVGVVVNTTPPTTGSADDPPSPRSPKHAVALCGLVAVRVCSDGGPISVGELLVSARRAGTAMRARDAYRALGAVVGKAMAPYRGEGDEGVIPMIAMSR